MNLALINLQESLQRFFQRNVWEVAVDIVDILLVSYLVYRVLLLIRGTRAMQMAFGLAVIVIVHQLARSLGFITLYTILYNVLSYIVLVIIVIFQNDIRRVLARVGHGPLFRVAQRERESRVIDEVVQAVGLLAQKRIGALVVFERDGVLDEFLHSGTVLDAVVSRDLIYSLFVPAMENPTHDGALVVRDERVWQAGAFLPLSASPRLERSLGTRHRAAIGLSEETDAVVVVVSEERGTISLCSNGELVQLQSLDELRAQLHAIFHASRRKKKGDVSRVSLIPGAGDAAS